VRLAGHRGWLLAASVLALVTTGLLLVRDSVDKTHVALAYLVVVLAFSSRGGRALGVSLSVAAFLCFNFFFLLPYYRLTIADPLDWSVLGAFLVASLVASQLLVRARNEAASAELRAKEIERLATLGAETLNAGRPEDALEAIAVVVRSTLNAAVCELHVHDVSGTRRVVRVGDPPLPQFGRPLGQPSAEGIIEWVAANGRAAVELRDGSMRVGESANGSDLARSHVPSLNSLVLPLCVRDRTVGVLTIMPEQTLFLDPAKERFLDALAYYAALGVERLRLAKQADRADALQKADEVKNAVLASVSHDLRTPLTTIKALAHEIRTDGDERAATIEEEADRLNRFVADLLDLSRLAGGALRVTPEINAAEDLVGAALQRVSGALEGRKLEAALDPSEPLLLGYFDFVHSLRVLGNLIDNAVKFAPAHSTVEVNAKRNDGALEFVVADRGPGIPADDRENVFRPFYRRADDIPDVGGVGLGLSIARGLAEAQGGSLRYEDRPGGGSVFVFSVPAADAGDLEGTS
jgi:two-component system, OmpR family, sensor histidine kinase KdpD